MINETSEKWALEEENEFAQRLLKLPSQEIMGLFRKFHSEFVASEEDILEYLDVNIYVLFREVPKRDFIYAVKEIEERLSKSTLH